MRLVLAACLCLAAASPVRGQSRPADFAKFESAAVEAWERERVGSVTIGMVKDGKLVAQRSLGFADIGRRTPAGPRTVYRIGSVTKAFTALMLLQLVEEGKVRFSDPVELHLPEFRRIAGWDAARPPVTLIQLATHTSGLAAEPEGEEYARGPVSRWEETLLSALPATRFESEPGTRFAYSNIGYAILGAALARASGRPYIEHVRKRIFEPLGMTDTGFEPNPKARSRLAAGYVAEGASVDGAQARADHAGRGYKVPAGAIYSTLEDMAKFVAFQMGHGPESVLARRALEEASRRLITVDRGMGEAYGIGFQLFTNGDVVLQGHAGGMPGYRSLQVFERESATGFIVLRNVTGGRFGDPVFMVFQALPPR